MTGNVGEENESQGTNYNNIQENCIESKSH